MPFAGSKNRGSSDNFFLPITGIGNKAGFDFRWRTVTPSVFYYSNYIFHNLIQFFCVKIAKSYLWKLWMLINFTDFYSFMTNYPSIIQHTWIPLLKINISNWPHFRHRTWMPHYLTRKCGAGLLICIRGSGKTWKQINENSTPHPYRMSFTYRYT